MSTSKSASGLEPKNSDSSSDYIDAAAMKNADNPGFQNKLDAVERVRFVRPISEGEQHLDVGCGWGRFTRDGLVPGLGHGGRIIAVDKLDSLLDYARENASHPNIIYEHLDIENDDPQPLLSKYGPFDRIYSLLTLHCIRNLEVAYRNIFRLLKDGGECAFVTLTGTDITDVMYRLSRMKQWKDYVPDPTKLFSERFFFETAIVAEKVVEAEKKALEAAGLTLVTSSVYDSRWEMQDVDAWIDFYVPMFKVDANIPKEKRDAFSADCRKMLAEKALIKDGGCFLRHSFVVIHAQKPPRD